MNARAVLIAGAATLAVVAVKELVLVGGHQYVVRAEFADASGLRPDYTVRLDGVTVGTIASVAATPQTTAMVTLDLDSSAAPVGRNASVSIQPSNLLGEKFVALNPGNTADPAPSGSLIPLSRTSTPTEFDQVVSAFNPTVRQAMATFLTEEGDALLGRGGDLATTFKRMPQSLQSNTTMIAQFAADNRALAALIDQSDRILVDVAGRRAALGHLVTSAGGALQTLASREQGLGATIVAAPPMLAQLRTSLLALQRAAVPVGQAAAGLRVTAAPLTSDLRAVPGFTVAALPTLRTLTHVSPTLDRLGIVAAPVIGRLEGFAGSLDTYAHTLDPVTKLFNDQIGNVLAVMEGWARAIQDRDGAGHVFRTFTVTPANEQLRGLLGNYADTGTLRRRHRRTRRSQSGRQVGTSHGTQTTATTPGRVGPPKAVTKVLGGVPAVVAPAVNHGVQQTGSSLNSLLNYLLKP